jgi:hypothetical protein
MINKFTKNPTTWEIAKAFGDNREIAIRIIYDYLKDTKDFDKVAKVFHHNHFRVIELKRYLQLTKPTSQSHFIDKDAIDSAKQVPIESLYDFQKRKDTSQRIQCSCPFHTDENPSLIIYKETNTFHCFSCKAGGDAITFFKSLHNVNFITAVKRMKG